jgi:hypothetical protein
MVHGFWFTEFKRFTRLIGIEPRAAAARVSASWGRCTSSRARRDREDAPVKKARGIPSS